ncbi:hypothetical protein CKY20_08855 [Capnocytophaga canis]|uniref:Carboxypeptidase-like regulatory domain-containing protein n=1 Tax=Capnocytophaga canis TaxID=1848903 RepID=A0A3A1YFK1_9FLAO|nr:hypothetical protein [Capnocytophaga canis]RIY35958.1 hypothetical protein CKY20_08855 [Capnocytophaga canis]
MNINTIKRISIFIALIFGGIALGQNRLQSVIVDGETKNPLEFVTIYNSDGYSISNSEGKFAFSSKADSLYISILGYEKVQGLIKDFAHKDTIYLKPKAFLLDEVEVSYQTLFSKMVEQVKRDYALIPHKEKFFLRCLVKKNGEIHTLVDISGILEKKTLYNTKSAPMPKNNYIVQVDNIRKVSDFTEYGFELYGFKYFLNLIASNNTPTENFSHKSEVFQDKTYTKLTISSKKITEEDKKQGENFTGYYLINNETLHFDKFYLEYTNPNADYKVGNKKLNLKFRFRERILSVFFHKNPLNGKKQIKNAILNDRREVLKANGEKDIFEISSYFDAFPIDYNTPIKNNIDLEKQIFEIKGKYNAKYWENDEILRLTSEMQEFVNKMNKNTDKSHFKTNIHK